MENVLNRNGFVRTSPISRNRNIVPRKSSKSCKERPNVKFHSSPPAASSYVTRLPEPENPRVIAVMCGLVISKMELFFPSAGRLACATVFTN